MSYKVIWEIEIHATSHLDAARKALAIQRDPNSIATVFDVTNAKDVRKVIDLQEEHENQVPALPANHRSVG